jgi:Nif-specific regulatory protein
VTYRRILLERHLNTIYEVSQVLSRSLNFQETLREVLEVLHGTAGMQHGMVTLRDVESGGLLLSAVHTGEEVVSENVRYRAGEGIVGTILQEGETLVVERIAEEPRFLGRLGLHDPELPFIGVPIRMDAGSPMGVLAAQPEDNQFLPERAHFLEMISNLIAQSVRLATEVEKERKTLTDERDRLRRAVRSSYGFENLVGHTAPMRRVFDTVEQVARWNTTVLIRGESGTGKELVAHAIHYNSPRAGAAFVKLNCAALPDNLLESELFGHEKGAFTGAMTQRKGRFEQADGGTLFLDEIGEISPAFQAKLLRVLQEGEFERVGGTRTLKVDVRIIAATNRDLESAVENGGFRGDLYYRLNVLPIQMPPLRDRMEDLPELASFLVAKIGQRQGRALELTDSAVRVLMRHRWPGNVRELENCLERAAVMSEHGVIDRDAIVATGVEERLDAGAPAAVERVELNDPGLDERERVIAALEQAGWVQAKAARLLQMTPRQIAYRIQILNIKVRQI